MQEGAAGRTYGSMGGRARASCGPGPARRDLHFFQGSGGQAVGGSPWTSRPSWRTAMKAPSLEAPRQWKRVEVPAPETPGPGEALVRVHNVGICGTDVSGYLGKMPFFSYPRIPGHELGVEVLEVGPGVDNVRPGDRCSVEPYINCQ